ncbi:P-loop NTPase fold protein [Kitasatospora sp. NPDC101801]|uniref:KAP family P-loop NTPase fold protein n=1 Tax=Kitasatospora sp. NPDC101801 TaxID=3364103 RepID=UPI00380F9CD3
MDLLSFDAVAETVVRAVLDDVLDPVTVGVSGAWGSGKTTVLRLVEDRIAPQAPDVDTDVLVISTDPWRYDPGVGAKETLIGEVLGAVAAELAKTEKKSGRLHGRARAMLTTLRKRVDWAKALQVAARTSLTLQLPSVDDLTSLVNTESAGQEDNSAEPLSRGLEEFREEFRALMESPELSHLRRVVVLVDDLDRCLPETVVDTLETIRLFLAVPKMAFVVAADERRVADALRVRFPTPGGGQGGAGADAEDPASLYLHKIVQTTVPLPTLSRFDTEAFLVLLQLSQRLAVDALAPYVAQCVQLRRTKGVLDELPDAVEGGDISAELAFASRMTPILYEKLQGSPRRIKRFLNDLKVRQSVAVHRGIALEADIVAKLMVLERLLPDSFATILEWLARGELRARMGKLEAAAGRSTTQTPAPEAAAPGEDGQDPAPEATAEEPLTFEDDLLRWAKLTPGLDGVDLAPYLYLAAAFSGKQLFDAGLPGRLRDIAANLLSTARFDQRKVTEVDITALGEDDALRLVEYLGRAARDRPAEQVPAVRGLVRVVAAYPAVTDQAARLLQSVPAAELEPATILALPAGKPDFHRVLEHWRNHAPSSPPHIRAALDSALNTGTRR